MRYLSTYSQFDEFESLYPIQSCLKIQKFYMLSNTAFISYLRLWDHRISNNMQQKRGRKYWCIQHFVWKTL